MPEGHTIHRLARDHKKWFVGQHMGLLSPQGRFAAEAAQLDGRKLQDVLAHGKHLFYKWPGKRYVHVHLGLYGKFRVHKNPAPEPRGAVRLRAIGTNRTFDLNGPNRCELVEHKDYVQTIDRLGEDPLRDDADPERLWNRLSKSRAPIGTLLLNQSVIAGVGNVYRAEILFLLGINPNRPALALDRTSFDRMWDLTVELLTIGVKYNRIITVPRSPDGPPLSRLNAKERLHIYKKKYCPICAAPVSDWLLGNRRIFACENCQSE